MDHITNLLASVNSTTSLTQDFDSILPMALFGLFLLLVLMGSFFGWITIAVVKFNKIPLPVRVESHACPPWGIVDLLVVGLIWIGVQLAGWIVMRRSGLLGNAPVGAESAQAFLLSSVFSITALVLATAWLISWFKSAAQYSGWSIRNLIYDVLLGAAVFVLFAPMLYTLMALTTLVTEVKYDHPLMKAINKDPSNIAIAFLVAVIVAPLAEEFLFRVLLQGYLQSIAEKASSSKIWIAMLGRGRLTPEESVSPINVVQPPIAVPQDSTNAIKPIALEPMMSSANPYGAATVVDSETYVDDQPIANSQLHSWPILVSGILFGLAHFDYGVSWLPLIFFGCVLGWLYQKTNRIWPGVIAHMFCNFIGVTSMALGALYGNPTA